MVSFATYHLDQELEEEGLSWDELERQAARSKTRYTQYIIDDKKYENKHGKEVEVPKQLKKRSKRNDDD